MSNKKKKYNRLGNYLAQSRVNANRTQKEVADLASYSSAQFISNIECGLALPSARAIQAYIELCRVSRVQVCEAMALYYRGDLTVEILGVVL